MKESLKKQIQSAFFAAVIAVLSIISIPTPGVPITLQTFAVALCGFLLGRKYGSEAVLIWIAVGALGLPVFSGMTGGLGKIFGNTGGFIIGFLPLVMLCRTEKSHAVNILYAEIGLIICHLLGIIQFKIITELSLFSVFLTASMPYLLKDSLLIIAAYTAALTVNKRLKT